METGFLCVTVLTVLVDQAGEHHYQLDNTLKLRKSPIWPGVVAHAFNPRTREAEAGKCLFVQSQFGLCNKFQAIQGYLVVTSLKTKTKTKTKTNEKAQLTLTLVILLSSWGTAESGEDVIREGRQP